MAEISRIASPMSLCEEDLFDTNKRVERKKKELRELQKLRPAPFLIGSIQKVSDRISELDSELSLFDCKIAAESHNSTHKDVYDPNTGTFHQKSRRSTRSAKDREERESQKFAGVFSQESVHVPDGKTNPRKAVPQQSDAPRLVELQQYPGYHSKRHTPLPHSLAATVVLDHVIAAQDDLSRKPQFRNEVRRMLYSRTQRSILQDAFWWFFLNKYHPSTASQSKLFKRIAQNYVAFFLSAKEPQFRNTFFMAYADILAQSIYSAFCLAFPQSWRQFDDPAFKEMLLSTTTEWIAGIRPRPGLYEKWNQPALEPEKMRKEVTNKKEKKAVMSIGKISPITSSASTKHSTAHSRAGSNKGILKGISARSEALSAVSSQKTKTNETTDKGTLSPITEVPRGIDDDSNQMRLRSTDKKSCAVGRAAEFQRCSFNIYGRSPLLSEVLQQKGLDRRTGYDHLIRRTQVESFPSKDALTYQQFLTSSSKSIQKTTRAFNKVHDKGEKSSNDFTNKTTEENRLYNMKANKILAKPRQVRYLSNLLLMEMKRDSDEVNMVGAVAALQSAIAAESTR